MGKRPLLPCKDRRCLRGWAGFNATQWRENGGNGGFDDAVRRVTEELATSLDEVLDIVEQDHGLVRFYIRPEARWAHIHKLPVYNLGQRLTEPRAWPACSWPAFSTSSLV